MKSRLFQRLIWNVIPSALVVGAVWMAMAGEGGILRGSDLSSQLASTRARTTRIEQENEALRRQIRSLRSDPAVVQRASAAGLLTAQPGSTIYRFQD